MRTTLDIDDDLLAAAKELARRENVTAGQVVSYQFAFNSLDIMSFHGLPGAVDEDSDRGRQGDRCALGR